MASETFDTRATLRARLRSRLGMSTSDVVMAQTTDQHNELLRGAARYVRDLCNWKRLEIEFEFATVIDQRYYTMPTTSGAGDVIRIARWDTAALQYVTLQERVIMPVLDTKSDLAGTDDEATRGKPILWEVKSELVGTIATAKIELWPHPDAVYSMKVEYRAGGAGFADDVTVSAVDSELILLWAYGDALEIRGDLDLADRQREKFERRRVELNASQQVGPIIVPGRAQEVRLKYGANDVRPTPTIYPYTST